MMMVVDSRRKKTNSLRRKYSQGGLIFKIAAYWPSKEKNLYHSE